MGETLEYLEELAANGDWEELENCGENINDWTGIKIPKKTKKTCEQKRKRGTTKP